MFLLNLSSRLQDMSAPTKRPWDRKKGVERFSSSTSTKDVKQEKDLPPFVEVDNNRYYSDRFYLLSADENEFSESKGCVCGAHGDPPTLNHTRLIESLDLDAVIVGTYTMSLPFLKQRYPKLCNVPTLILHGDKTLQKQLDRDFLPNNEFPCKKQKQEESESGQESDNDHDFSRVSVKLEEEPPEEAWFKFQQGREEEQGLKLSDCLHFTRIQTTHLPNKSVVNISESNQRSHKKSDDGIIVIDDDSDISNSTFIYHGVHPQTIKNRRSKRGVHHAKYWLLFEKSGSLIILVSTANLVHHETVDGIWLQRFPPGKSKPANKSCRYDGSDFGQVLIDFLQHSSDAARAGDALPEEFLKHYLGINALSDLLHRYCFDDCQVHLISTVPGDYSSNVIHLGQTHNGKTSFLYGSQRIADIWSRLTKLASPWIPSSFIHNHDRLVAQPTSLGGFWSCKNIIPLLRRYLGDISTSQKNSFVDRLDIVWPSYEFIKKTRKENDAHCLNYSLPNIVTSGRVESKSSNHQPSATGFVFLSAKVFNTLDLDVISRLGQYHHNVTLPNRVPHFKSYARLYEGDDYSLRQKYKLKGKAAEMLPWFLLTSACFSRGAQGDTTHQSKDAQNMVSYTNFELGVLFCSRLQRDDEHSNRIYCWRPNECSCQQSKNCRPWIHLPVPYSLRPLPYVTENSDDVRLVSMPFFHEVEPPELISVGKMTLTPWGKAQAHKTETTISLL